jgi:NAD(P)H dehydrogenase (quinone)
MDDAVGEKRALIVSAHPEQRSFHVAMRSTAAEELAAAGYHVDISDLYAMQFKAVLDRRDFSISDDEYLNVSLAQRNGWKQRTLAPDIVTEVNRLLACDFLLLMFPLWWFGMPAILKGWIDRIFLSGVTYGRTAIFEHGRLPGKKAMLCLSTGAPEDSFGPYSLNGDMEHILMPVQRGVLGFTGMTVLPPFVAYHVPYIGSAGRTRVLQNWREHIGELDTLTALAMPRLTDFPKGLSPDANAH